MEHHVCSICVFMFVCMCVHTRVYMTWSVSGVCTRVYMTWSVSGICERQSQIFGISCCLFGTLG